MRKGKLVTYATFGALTAGVVGVAVLIPRGENAEAAGSIVSSFQPEKNLTNDLDTYRILGVAPSGINLWFTDDYTGQVYQINPGGPQPGAIISSFAVPGYDYLKGVAPVQDPIYGDCLWLCTGGPAKILKITTTGSVVSSFNIAAYANGGGLGWDGTYIYNVDYDACKIYKYTPGGSIVTSFTTPDNQPASCRVPFGLTYDGTYLWLTSYGKDDLLYKLNAADGAVVGSWPFQNEHPHVLAITAEGPYLRYVDDSADCFFLVEK